MRHGKNGNYGLAINLLNHAVEADAEEQACLE